MKIADIKGMNNAFWMTTEDPDMSGKRSVLRSYLRQRENLAAAAMCVQHMQKALTEMNIQLANVISDISGTTGMAILGDILRGERNPERLARHKRARTHSAWYTLSIILGESRATHYSPVVRTNINYAVPFHLGWTAGHRD